jgi:polyisoprenoid-binding protein YceI
MATERLIFDLAHSSIGFWVRHLMVSKVHGRFSQWTGSLEFDEQQPGASRISVSIDAASIDTKEAARDGHLRSPDFLDAEHFPHITFTSTSVAKTAGGELLVSGDLTIRGVTRPVQLAAEYAGRVKDPWGGERLGFSATTTINRSDYGLTWNQGLEAGGVLVSDKIEISIEIEAVREVPQAAAA